uniref:Uncharacterized protein n=1 Tax=Cannabis sativa TaxID=3483 RepID=A0A803P348_CANSA
MEIGTVPSTILSQEEDIADVPLPQNFTDQENVCVKMSMNCSVEFLLDNRSGAALREAHGGASNIADKNSKRSRGERSFDLASHGLQLGESSGRVSSGAEKKGYAVGRVSSSEI